MSPKPCGERASAVCASTRPLARISWAGIWSVPCHDQASRGSNGRCSRICSDAARRRPSSSECRPNASSCSRPTSRSDAARTACAERTDTLPLLLRSGGDPKEPDKGTTMLYIVQFEDKPNMGELRDKLFKSHIEFLDRMKDRVLVPGSMREVPSDKPLGGLWIIEAKDEAEIREIFKDDPFWTNGMRASVRINRWQKAFPDRKVPI